MLGVLMKYFVTLGLFIALSAQAKKTSDLPGMPGSSMGDDAIAKHAHHLDKIAKKYKLSVDKLKKGLTNDHSMRLTTNGDIYYVEPPQEAPAYLNDSTDILNYNVSHIPDSETFKLHSRPGAKRVLLLDFNGQQVQSAYWNSGNLIDALPLSNDADPAFSSAELQIIKEIWLRVAEDYAPFDVDITTEDISDSTLLANKGMRAVITQTSSWYGSAGGVAYLESIDWSLNIPCFIFSSLLSNSPKNVAEATSHELGHTLGLYHQSQYNSTGGFVTEYSPGTGTGDLGWAPIMGNSYSRKNSTWDRGSNSFGFTSIQDDIQVMLTRLSLVVDDAPNVISSNTFLNLRSSQDINSIKFKHQGMIETRGDVDVLRLQLGQGPLSVAIKGPTYRLSSTGVPVQGNNLDFRVILKASNGEVISDIDLPGSTDININQPDLAAGIYYLEIKAAPHTVIHSGVIELSDYGSLGRYYISGTGVISGSVVAPVAPVVSAGADKSITLPTSSASLAGTASDSDGSLASVAWSQVSGPAQGVFSAASSLSTSVSGLSVAGTYTFRLKAIDLQGLSATDDVVVTVKITKKRR